MRHAVYKFLGRLTLSCLYSPPYLSASRNRHGLYPSISFPHADNGRLALRAATWILLLAVNPTSIAFTRQTQAVEDIPYGIPCSVAKNSRRGHEDIGGHNPFLGAYFGVFERGVGKGCEILAAISAPKCFFCSVIFSKQPQRIQTGFFPHRNSSKYENFSCNS